jgi:hypothetical protein
MAHPQNPFPGTRIGAHPLAPSCPRAHPCSFFPRRGSACCRVIDEPVVMRLSAAYPREREMPYLSSLSLSPLYLRRRAPYPFPWGCCAHAPEYRWGRGTEREEMGRIRGIRKLSGGWTLSLSHFISPRGGASGNPKCIACGDEKNNQIESVFQRP